MIIIGAPRFDYMEKYYMADAQIAFQLQQANFHPLYIDDDCFYFKKNKKLVKKLSELGIEF